ncbi:MAG: hypothetical protein NC416_02925 [Eubacterium sp.]|nr:hypothetical protein [Eubacterium sp.]
MENRIDSAQLLQRAAKQKIAIYGAGHVAKKLLTALKLYGYDKNILCFLVSDLERNGKTVGGIPVKTTDWLFENRNVFVYVAVHESLWCEIEDTLKSIGVSHYTWVYPYLYELLLGLPVKTNIKVDVKDIVQTCADDYRLAIRYAAIGQYFGKNKVGFDLYKRAQALHSTLGTAQERLTAFCRLIEKWQENGYDEQSRIAINTDHEIIDGCHRVALACYFKQKQIVCDVFENHISATELHGENVMLTDRILITAGFNADEMKYLGEINRMIKDGV